MLKPQAIVYSGLVFKRSLDWSSSAAIDKGYEYYHEVGKPLRSPTLKEVVHRLTSPALDACYILASILSATYRRGTSD